MSARAASAPGAGVLDRLQVLRSAPTPLRGAPAATWTPSPRTGVGPLRVPGPGLQPSSHDTTTTRTDPAGSTLARPDFGPKDGVHLKIRSAGKGRYLDNIFVERLWRSLKYEEIYLHPYDSLTEAREEIGRYFRFYNDARPHTSLGYQSRPRSMTRRRGAPPHERACRLGAGCRCARPPPGSPLRSDPAPRGAGGDLDPVSAHRRGAITGSRPRPATQLARHDHDENRPGRLHLSKARFWSERWGPPHVAPRQNMGAIFEVSVEKERRSFRAVALSVWHDEATALHQGRSRQAEVHGQIYDAVLVRR